MSESTDGGRGVPTLELNDGHSIPQLGFGVFQIPPEDTAAATTRALEIGYRHIDTAEMYQNERGVGEAVARSGLDRSEVFVTSKLNNGFHHPDEARKAFDATLDALGFDYVDLFLIHWPLPGQYGGDFVSTWRTLVEFSADGRARSIGVSNFQSHHIDRLVAETGTVPAVNQIEIHPYLTQDPLRAYGREHGIATEAWSPIAQGKVLDDPAIAKVASIVGKTAAQVVLRWHIRPRRHRVPQVGDPVPDAGELRDLRFLARPDDDVAAISGLNRDERTGPDPDDLQLARPGRLAVGRRRSPVD